MTRVAELTLKSLDGALSVSESAELDALLASDPGAEIEHLDLLALEAELRGLLADLDIADATVARIQDAQADRAADAVLATIRAADPPAWARTEPTPAPRRRGRWLVAAACAAVALVAVWFGAKSGPIVLPPDDEVVPADRAFAKLARKSGFVEVLNPAGEAFAVEEGGELPAGFTLRTGDDSRAVVDLVADRSRVEIEPDTVVRFRAAAPERSSDPQLFLAGGQLTATVSERPSDRPLVVGTPVTEVLARSGLFVVSSAGPDTARVDIRKGAVELVRAAAPKPVPVGVGSALVTAGFDRVQIEAPAVDRVPVRTLAFVGARDALFSADGSEVWVANARAFTRWGAAAAPELSFYARKAEGVAGFTRDRRFLVTFRGDREDRVLVRTLLDGGEHAALNVRIGESRFWTAAPDGSWLAAAEAKPFKQVRLVDVASGDTRFEAELPDSVGCVASSPDGRVLTVGVNDLGRGTNNKVLLLDARTGERLAALPTQRKALTALAYSGDGRFLAAGFNGAVQVWDVRSRELLRTITGFERGLTALAFSADARLLAAGAQDGSVWVWNAATGAQTQLIESGGRGIRALAFSPDGRELVTAAASAPVAVWSVTRAPDVQ